MRWRDFQSGTNRPAHIASWNKPPWRQEYRKQVIVQIKNLHFASWIIHTLRIFCPWIPFYSIIYIYIYIYIKC